MQLFKVIYHGTGHHLMQLFKVIYHGTGHHLKK